jgi:glyoxylase-like metal-dependent hydrolase (beta-lactamase superfamily II)
MKTMHMTARHTSPPLLPARPGWAACARRLLLWVCVCAGFVLATTAQAQNPAVSPPCPRLLKPAAPGVWVWEGHRAEISPDNRGHVATSVVLVGERSIAVVDPGPSLAHGRTLREAIRCQFGRQAERVINTHAHAENVMGNAAFAELALPILATATTQASMQQRCPGCLQSITLAAGAAALAGTQIEVPNTLLTDGQVLDLGGQRWQALEQRAAHTESDLVLWHAASATLIAGGLVYRDRVPELAQGSLVGWIQALHAIENLRPQTVIGFSTGSVDDLIHTRRYLCTLAESVWQAMEAGQSAHDAVALRLPDYAHWAGYTARHSFNAQRAWRELEPLWMAALPRPCSVPDVGR